MIHRLIRVAIRAMPLAVAAAVWNIPAIAQDRLKTMPGYERYQRVTAQIPAGGAVRLGAVAVTWSEDGRSFEYARDGKLHRYDLAARRAAEIGDAPDPAGGRGGSGGPARGRQAESAESPDKKLEAFYRDRNLWLSDVAGGGETALTTDGNASARIKYGTASWVYGEELRQTTAIWWAPDSRKVAYYRFDEKQVPDYYLQLSQTKIQSTVDTEAYPKAGAPNPIVDVYVYDVATKKTARVDVRDGKPFDNGVVGHYVYKVGWSPDGTELTFNRTNRRQNILEYTACNPDSGACRAIVREEWPASWVANHPDIQFLKDNRRFVWGSERSGWKNFYLYDMSGTLQTTLTRHQTFEVTTVVRIDEAAGFLYYMARDGQNHMKLQLHRVGLDGTGDKRLTDPALNHTVTASPDGKYFIDVAQAHDVPPVTRLIDAHGTLIDEIATSDTTTFDALGLKTAELFTYKAADGQTELHGLLHKPSNFDPTRKYPLLITVYAGPGSNGARETFTTPSPITEYGFLVASLDSRSASGKGKRALDAIYMKLGTVEIDDQAAGVKALAARTYVDKNRVGIYGTSYGGYAAVMAILRYPDVFHAASASSAVTSWYHYDTIYTERYMWIPQENKEGYEAGSAMRYADKLKGRLMIYYGTADNNVHPSNGMQLIQAFQTAGKSFDLQVGPDAGHSGIRQDRMMEFFIENLVMKPAPASSTF
ncbi:MAG: S9 family peptidase [Acidobacteria bacterium]|nr:S9 family peptidase [Acidobacteriota bacterium]